LSALSQDRGWVNTSEFIDNFGRSRATAYRRLNQLAKIMTKSGPLVHRAANKTVIRSKFLLGTHEKYRINFSLAILSDILAFKKHYVLQSALMLQQRFRGGHSSSIKEKVSYSILDLREIPVVEICPTRLKNKVGAAFSKIAESTNLSKSYVHSLISEYQEHQRVLIKKLPWWRFKKAWNGIVQREVKLSYEYSSKNKVASIFYTLPSTYDFNNKDYSSRKDYSKSNKLLKK